MLSQVTRIIIYARFDNFRWARTCFFPARECMTLTLSVIAVQNRQNAVYVMLSQIYECYLPFHRQTSATVTQRCRLSDLAVASTNFEPALRCYAMTFVQFFLGSRARPIINIKLCVSCVSHQAYMKHHYCQAHVQHLVGYGIYFGLQAFGARDCLVVASVIGEARGGPWGP